jgi:hypothetical protein
MLGYSGASQQGSVTLVTAARVDFHATSPCHFRTVENLTILAYLHIIRTTIPEAIPMLRKVMSVLGCSLLVFLVAVEPAEAKKKSGATRLVDTEEYEEDDFEKGIIEDYSDMVEGDGVEWVYLADGVSLNDYSIKVGKVKNESDISNKSMLETAEETLNDALDRKGNEGRKGTLTAETAVYWAERRSEGKRWIPYAGGHLAQAGVGIEMILRDSKGTIVAKIRHSGRQGDELDHAAEEVADEIVDFISEN